MSAAAILRLTVPGHLRFRSVAVRFVAEACRLVSGAKVVDERGGSYEVQHAFDTAFVSAFMEIFNNIALHAYRNGAATGDIEFVATVGNASLTVELRDNGEPFNLESVPVPELDSLPEGGMGIHIARTMLDEMVYQAGPPNIWRLTKRIAVAGTARSVAT
jgi:anti-sigma regulatory factor (Ser/Thr protein kinase)